jgi:mono/diheme cytochrome c family protein
MKISLHNHLQKEYDKQRDRLRPERRPWWKFWGRLTAKRDWIKREFQREWPRWQNNAGYVIYEKWRERREEQLFRTWKTQREGELYLAWQGREIYAQVGCSRCHGTDGNGQQLPTKATSPPIQQQHRHNLIGANPRCGNQMFDFYRSIITGVGQQMPMLSSEDIRPLVGKMQIIRGSLEQYRDDPPAKLRQALWSLAAYAQFLAHQNPIQRGAKMRE